jgi:hypothetical protein
MTEDTWSARDLAVLRAVVKLYEKDGEYFTNVVDITHETGIDEETLQRALRALNSSPSYFDDVSENQNGIDAVGPPTAAARRAVGAWPSPENVVERIIVALEQAGEDDAQPDEQRGRFKQLALGIRSFGYQVAINALGSAGGNVLGG